MTVNIISVYGCVRKLYTYDCKDLLGVTVEKEKQVISTVIFKIILRIKIRNYLL